MVRADKSYETVTYSPVPIEFCCPFQSVFRKKAADRKWNPCRKHIPRNTLRTTPKTGPRTRLLTPCSGLRSVSHLRQVSKGVSTAAKRKRSAAPTSRRIASCLGDGSTCEGSAWPRTPTIPFVLGLWRSPLKADADAAGTSRRTASGGSPADEGCR